MIPSLVRWMLDQKVAVDHKDNKGNTPLHEACRGGFLEIVQLLIKAGAKVEVFNNEQVQPLIIALCVSKDEKMSKSIVEVHPNPGLTLPSNGETLLINAVKGGFYELMEALIKREVNLDSQDSDGNTAVHHAVRKDDIKSLKLLAKHGADLNRKNNNDYRPITNAISLKSPSCVLEIVNSPKFKSFIYTDGDTILTYACRVSSPEVVKVLIDSKKIDIDEQDKMGNTALHCAYLKNDSALVKILLEAGAKQQIPNKKGEFPLDSAIESENKEMAELLISYHDDINYSKIECRPHPSHLNRALKNENFEATKSLIDKGCSLKKLFNKHMNIFHGLARRGWHDLWNPAFLKLKEQLQQVDTPRDDDTLNSDISSWINHQDKYKKTPLHYAIEKGHSNSAIFIIQHSIKHNLDLYLRDVEGNTPLHSACKNNMPQVAELIASHLFGQEFYSEKWRNKQGETPLALSLIQGQDFVPVVTRLTQPSTSVTAVTPERSDLFTNPTYTSQSLSPIYTTPGIDPSTDPLLPYFDDRTGLRTIGVFHLGS